MFVKWNPTTDPDSLVQSSALSLDIVSPQLVEAIREKKIKNKELEEKENKQTNNRSSKALKTIMWRYSWQTYNQAEKTVSA